MRCQSSGSRSCSPRRSRWPPRASSPLRAAAPLLALLHSSTHFELARDPPRGNGRRNEHWRIGMRALALIVISLCTALAPAVAAAQDAAELRRQIEQLQKELQSVTERLQRLEAQPPPATAPAAPPAPPAAAAPPPAAAPPSALDLVRPREPYALYQQRGSGQLLFDVGLTGDFVGNFTQRNVEKANGGTFAGQENRFFPREIELSLFGQIDPYASAVVRIEAGEEE